MAEPNGPHTESGSYGIDDVFTLSWLSELVGGYFKQDDDSPVFAEYSQFRKAFLQLVQNRLDECLKLAADGKPLFTWQAEIAPAQTKEGLVHAFPLLRVLHLWSALDKPTTASVDRLVDDLRTRFHLHIAYSTIENSNFDAAELVFSLEGLILRDRHALDPATLDRAFSIIRETQRKNPYWRPLRPFISTSQGFALLPLSVEIANSLLRICNYLDRELHPKSYFTANIELFKAYTSWLLSRVVRDNDTAGRAFVGWHSEHVFDRGKIHLWETSQVLLYLIHYSGMLQGHIARRAKASVSLGSSTPSRDAEDKILNAVSYWQNRWESAEPLGPIGEADHEYQSYGLIRKHFLEPRISEKGKKLYSMLLYGPPGTGKTATATALAKALGVELITITPSDFIARGEAQVEERAKLIFEALREQVGPVIFFDEIDRLILDRDSLLYQEQSDIFQFMTPGMLTKVKDLRDKEQCVFIIGTNYADHIDPALKRKGRMDKQYLVMPPDTARRRTIISDLIERRSKGERKISSSALARIAAGTPLATYGELKQIVDDALASQPSTDEMLERAIEAQPVMQAIRIAAYRSRFECMFDKGASAGKFLSAQQPYDEFLMIAYLYLESGAELHGDDREVFVQVVKDAIGNRANETMKGWLEHAPEAIRAKLPGDLHGHVSRAIVDGLKRYI